LHASEEFLHAAGVQLEHAEGVAPGQEFVHVGVGDAAAVAAIVFMIGLIVVLGIVTVMLILAIIFPIMGAIRANGGEEYRYPFPHIKILDEDG